MRYALRMAYDDIEWSLICDAETFERCKQKKEFSQLVALARCVNAMNFIHSAVQSISDPTAPSAYRERMNFYFFASAILYEALGLIKKLKATFGRSERFQKELLPLLKDKRAQEVASLHLKPVRHGSVFHFDTEAFKKAIDAFPRQDCIFFAARGRKNKDVHYQFADRMTVRMMIGSGVGDMREQIEKAIGGINDLKDRFLVGATNFLVPELKEWGFKGFSSPEHNTDAKVSVLRKRR